MFLMVENCNFKLYWTGHHFPDFEFLSCYVFSHEFLTKLLWNRIINPNYQQLDPPPSALMQLQRAYLYLQPISQYYQHYGAYRISL